VSFHSIPAEIKHQGEKTRKLSARRRQAWISRINRKDWEPNEHTKVCSDHFITGRDLLARAVVCRLAIDGTVTSAQVVISY